MLTNIALMFKVSTNITLFHLTIINNKIKNYIFEVMFLKLKKKKRTKEKEDTKMTYGVLNNVVANIKYKNPHGHVKYHYALEEG